MSDAGIETLYEQELQAKARYRAVIVTFHGGRQETVRKFMDTPEGRVRAEKCAGEWLELKTVKQVSVVPVGAGVDAGQGNSAGGVHSRADEPKRPAPSRSTGCCKPTVYAGPSGKRLRHAFDCPAAMGQVYEGPVADISSARLHRQHLSQTLHTGIDEAIDRHPAGGVLHAVDEWCPVHGSEPVYGCLACSERR